MEIASRKDNQKIIFGLLLATLLLLAAIFLPALIIKMYAFSAKNIFIISRVLYWLCLFALIIYAAGIEKNNFLLWQEKNYTITFYLAVYPALFGILFFGVAIINSILIKGFHVSVHPEKLDAILSFFRANKWLVYITVITAGVVEELIFRGYLMPRLQIVFKTKFWAVFISSALFGLAHFTYGTVLQVVGPFYIGLIFALFYEKYRNIKTLIVIHTIWDLLSISLLLAHHT